LAGPHLVVEHAPQELGGNLALHVHTMYRDPTNDYGRKPLQNANARSKRNSRRFGQLQ
jgi:hypothetical protein